MARPELGTKRVCPTTGRKFYDLNRDPIVSPYSGEVLPRTGLDLPVSGRPGRAAAPEPDDEEETELTPASGPETVSLEDVSAAEEEAADVGDEEEAAGGEAATDDTFLEEEEEGGDVSDLIDGDIEEDEEG